MTIDGLIEDLDFGSIDVGFCGYPDKIDSIGQTGQVGGDFTSGGENLHSFDYFSLRSEDLHYSAVDLFRKDKMDLSVCWVWINLKRC